MSRNRLASARKAENICSYFLREKAYQILSRNRKVAGVEIDIIAQKIGPFGLEILLVECKYVKGSYRFFSRKQKKRYHYAANFLQSNVKPGVSVGCMLIVVGCHEKVVESFYF